MGDDKDYLSENEKGLYSDEAVKPPPIEDVLEEPPVVEDKFLPEETTEEEDPPPLAFGNEVGDI